MTGQEDKLLIEEIRAQSAQVLWWLKLLFYALVLIAVVGFSFAYLELQQLDIIARGLQ